jgi:hypothetical protein
MMTCHGAWRWTGQAARVVVLAALILVSNRMSAAQTVRDVEARSECEGCRVEVLPGPRLGDERDAVLLGDLVHEVVRLTNGSFIVAGSSSMNELLVFSKDGAFSGVIGRAGPGPGELAYVNGVKVIAGDSIVALQVGRASVFGPSGAHARTVATSILRAPGRVYLRSDGRGVYSDWIRTPELAGLQFHLLDRGLTFSRSFGAVPPDEQVSCARCAAHTVAWSFAHPSHFWTLAPNRYEIVLWTEDGAMVERLVVASSWFESWRRYPPGDERPPAVLASLAEDPTGLLWITAYAANAQWRAPPPLPPPGSPDYATQMQRVWDVHARNFDTVIEVIDPSDGGILGDVRVEGQTLVPVGGTPGAYWMRQQDRRTGLVQLQIYTAALRPAGR